jgi:hypothetical protein
MSEAELKQLETIEQKVQEELETKRVLLQKLEEANDGSDEDILDSSEPLSTDTVTLDSHRSIRWVKKQVFLEHGLMIEGQRNPISILSLDKVVETCDLDGLVWKAHGQASSSDPGMKLSVKEFTFDEKYYAGKAGMKKLQSVVDEINNKLVSLRHEALWAVYGAVIQVSDSTTSLYIIEQYLSIRCFL